MATETTHKARLTSPGLLFPFIAITILFFAFGFITNLNQGMVPELKQIFEVRGLATWEAMLANFAFFMAYFVFATPTAWLIETIGYKKTMIVALFVQVVGALLFLPAASMVSFPLFMVAIFIVGAGVTALQTSANPYTTSLGPEETSPARLTLGQAFNTLGATIGSLVAGTFILTGKLADPKVVAQQSIEQQHLYQTSIADTVRIPYIVVAVALLLLGFAVMFAHLPLIKAEEKKEDGGVAVQRSIWTFKHTVLAAVSIFCYVGVEVGLATTMVLYFSDSAHGGLNVMTVQTAQKLVAIYWTGALVGRLFGPLMMSALRPGKLIGLFGGCAALLVILATFLPGYVAVGALLMIGLFNSIMFPTIFALGLVGLGPLTSRGSGIITTMVVGGALLPPLIGWVVDQAGYRTALVIPVACYAFIAWFGISGSKPTQTVA